MQIPVPYSTMAQVASQTLRTIQRRLPTNMCCLCTDHSCMPKTAEQATKKTAGGSYDSNAHHNILVGSDVTTSHPPRIDITSMKQTKAPAWPQLAAALMVCLYCCVLHTHNAPDGHDNLLAHTSQRHAVGRHTAYFDAATAGAAAAVSDSPAAAAAPALLLLLLPGTPTTLTPPAAAAPS